MLQALRIYSARLNILRAQLSIRNNYFSFLNMAGSEDNLQDAETQTESSYDVRYEIKAADMPEGVIEAFDSETRQLVHIKPLPEFSQEEAEEDFLPQAELVAKLKHQNLIRVMDYGINADKVAFLIFEKFEGTNLRDFIKDNGPLEIEKAIDFSIKAIEGLKYLHGKGVMHGSISLLNVHPFRELKSMPLNLKISGLLDIYPNEYREYEEDSLTVEPFYSPEQLETEQADFRTDVFSLGCLIYSVVTGHSPDMETLYQAKDSEEILEVVQSELIPTGLESIIEKCVAREPDERFQDLSELLGALKAVKLSTKKKSAGEKIEKPSVKEDEKNENSTAVPQIDDLLALDDLQDEKGVSEEVADETEIEEESEEEPPDKTSDESGSEGDAEDSEDSEDEPESVMETDSLQDAEEKEDQEELDDLQPDKAVEPETETETETVLETEPKEEDDNEDGGEPGQTDNKELDEEEKKVLLANLFAGEAEFPEEPEFETESVQPEIEEKVDEKALESTLKDISVPAQALDEPEVKTSAIEEDVDESKLESTLMEIPVFDAALTERLSPEELGDQQEVDIVEDSSENNEQEKLESTLMEIPVFEAPLTESLVSDSDSTSMKEEEAGEEEDLLSKEEQEKLESTLMEIPVFEDSLTSVAPPDSLFSTEKTEKQNLSDNERRLSKTLTEIPAFDAELSLTQPPQIEEQSTAREPASNVKNTGSLRSLIDKSGKQSSSTIKKFTGKPRVNAAGIQIDDSEPEPKDTGDGVQLTIPQEIEDSTDSIGIARPEEKAAPKKGAASRALGRIASTMIAPAATHNSYQKLQDLGTSDLYTVYKARETNTGTIVAAKTLKPLDERVTKVFVRQAQKHAGLLHKNIVRSVGSLDTSLGRPFFIMDYLKGITLNDLLKSVGRIDTVTEFTMIFSQILDAVQYAHSKGVVHGNLRPSNILLQEEDGAIVVKVLDFGMHEVRNEHLKVTGEAPSADHALYMSPEQFKNETPGPVSDVYQLGILGFKMLTGIEPVTGGSFSTIMTAKLDNEAESASINAYRQNLRNVEVLNSILQKCLHSNPENRLQSVADLNQQVNSWSRNRPTREIDKAERESNLKAIIQDQVRLRQTQYDQEGTLMMKFTTIAGGGSRRSPVKTVLSLVLQILFVVGFSGYVIVNFSTLKKNFHNLSLSLSNQVFKKENPNQEGELGAVEEPIQTNAGSAKIKDSPGQSPGGSAKSGTSNRAASIRNRSQRSTYVAPVSKRLVAPEKLPNQRISSEREVYPYLYTAEDVKKLTEKTNLQSNSRAAAPGDSEIKVIK